MKGISIEACILSSLVMKQSEGKSIIELAESKGFKKPSLQKKTKFICWIQRAETRSSGIDMEGIHIRKGAYDAIRNKVEQAGNKVPNKTMTQTKKLLFANGGTPLVVTIL